MSLTLDSYMVHAIQDVFLEAIIGVIWDDFMDTNWDVNWDVIWDASYRPK